MERYRRIPRTRSVEQPFYGYRDRSGGIQLAAIRRAAKLWYIPQGKEWRYKTNALNAMLNNYDPKYLPVIKKVCQDEYCEVRDMAEWVLEEIERKDIGESENGQ